MVVDHHYNSTRPQYLYLFLSKFENEITQWRHYFHENPELAYKEKNTAKSY